MKLLNRQKETVKLVAESADDLWYLYTIVDKGDICSGDSEYKSKLGGTDAKSQVVKRRVFVTLKVEKVEFDATMLRISGKVTGGSEEVPRGSFHTLDIAPGSKLELSKEHWLDYQTEKLEEALSVKSSTMLVLFDRESALFILLKPSGYETMLTLKGDVPRKGVDEQKIHNFYKEIAKHITEYLGRGIESIIAASPSFWKEYLEKELGDVRKHVTFATISTVDETAVKEILLRPELQQALKQQRSARELHEVGKMLEALAREKLVYGKEDLRQAILEGNIAEIMVTENAITKAKEEERFDELERMMRHASQINAAVKLLSTEDAMTKVDGLGGIVGIRRW